MKKLTQMLRKQAGQALPMALVLLALGAMIIVPTLIFTTTNLTATRVVDQHTREIYAADAGVEDGLWKVEHDYVPDWLMGDWTENSYAHEPMVYDVHDSDIPSNIVPVNNQNVNVSIKPIWVLDNLETQSTQQGSLVKGYGRTPDDRLLTFGSLNGSGIYDVTIYYDGSLGTLKIQRIGCWLPPGVTYSPHTSNLEQDPSKTYYCVSQTFDHNGGQAVTWNYSGDGIDYNSLPSSGNRKLVTFQFTPDSDLQEAFSWVRTNNSTIKLSWDTSKKVFELESKSPAGSTKQTTISAHSVKKEFQAMGAAISGDYQATGNTLMRNHNAHWGDSDERERLYNNTSATISTIPDDAVPEEIFLYWSGWKCKPWDVRSYTPAQLAALPLSQSGGKYLNKVAIQVKVGTKTLTSTVTATTAPQVMVNRYGNDPHGWTYSCFADITDLVNNYFKDQGVPFYGNATYTVGHWDVGESDNTTYRYELYTWKDNHTQEPGNGQESVPPYHTRYPLGSPTNGNQTDGSYQYEDCNGTVHNCSEDQWSHAAWSVVVIYSSPSTKGHHLYVFDTFLHCDSNHTLEFPIKGFLAPQDVLSDPNAARVTCLVGEGDSIYTGDSFIFNNNYLSDAYNPANNVWNSRSNVLGGAVTDNGIDIDTFLVGNGIIQPGDTQATIRMPTGTDTWNLVYMVLSFYSEITTGGTIDYIIK